MKLFMEINPQLFDDCSHDYTELQSTADQREAARKARWDKLAELAGQAQPNGQAPVSTSTGDHRGPKVTPPAKIDEDTATIDNQKRLDALRIQDETVNGKDATHDVVS